MYDKDQKRVVHFASNPQDNFLTLFNEPNFREFYSNKDYVKVGGREGDLDISSKDNDNGPLPDTEATETPGTPVGIDTNIELLEELNEKSYFSGSQAPFLKDE